MNFDMINNHILVSVETDVLSEFIDVLSLVSSGESFEDFNLIMREFTSSLYTGLMNISDTDLGNINIHDKSCL